MRIVLVDSPLPVSAQGTCSSDGRGIRAPNDTSAVLTTIGDATVSTLLVNLNSTVGCCGNLTMWRFCLSDPNNNNAHSVNFEATIWRYSGYLNVYDNIYTESITVMVQASNDSSSPGLFQCFETPADSPVVVEANDLVGIRPISIQAGVQLLACRSQDCPNERVDLLSIFDNTVFFAPTPAIGRTSISAGSLSLVAVLGK